ncbi:hypothetical protein EKO23_20090 [Nocardioides guangzhouensis]|uniref:Pentapeptide repeat-containing protein n=1 Tax=Nocardioides guangzhouensis TaxID=2497878 RepID=A0A4Q4Z7R2_9ACTN|nr:hypothetical protein [Nocardioides guangzhouensis]RYP83034.1 hypothetical protein EKO23_20090 [Nocardioides guangzhouensis]
MKTAFRSPGTIVLSILLLLLIATGVAQAAATIGSAQIKDGSIKSVDVKNNNLTAADLKEASVGSSEVTNNSLKAGDLAPNSVGSSEITDGSITTNDLSAAARSDLTSIPGPNWGIIDRNVIGNGDAYLRSGPSNGPEAPPGGVGSLGLRTGSDQDATAFGNQVNFLNDQVLDLRAVSYSVFTTPENNAQGPNNMPSIAIEINPRLDSLSGDTYATMVYTPANPTVDQTPGAPLVWSSFNAVSDPERHWGLTSVPTGTQCANDGPRCTFVELLDFLDDGALDPVIYTVGISLGRYRPFSGAVDNLRINGTTYDFEANGVVSVSTP